MRQIVVPGTSLLTSRFIMGTGNLFTGQSAREAESFLERAVAVGFSHFDTAPYYGFGFAERALKPILRRHPKLSVTTKAGLYAPGGENQRIFQILARKIVGRIYPPISRAQVDLSVARARESLFSSLRRLGRDHVELFLVHEPNAALMNTDEWLKWLSRERECGRVGSFGVAGAKAWVEPFLHDVNGLGQVVQLPDSIEGRDAEIVITYKRAMQITYGYVSRRGSHSVHEILLSSLRRNTEGAIIVSTRHVDRLDQYPAALMAAGEYEGAR